MAGVAGLEPTALGFGDQCSTNWTIPLQQKIFYQNILIMASVFYFVKNGNNNLNEF